MKKLLILLGLFTVLGRPALAAPLKIVALVNGEIISTEDFQSRINSFVMNTQIPLNEQTRGMMMQKVLNAAIDEKLKLQEAEKNGISITEDEIKAQISNIEKKSKIPAGQLTKILKEADVNPQTIHEQVKSDLAWLRLIRKKYYMEGTPTQKEINAALKEAQEDLSTPKFLVSEIYIKKDNARNLSDLVYNLRNDDRFGVYAMQFSDSPSAANGGNLGWVNTGKLPSALETRLKRMNPGDISDPIQVGDGYYILKLNQTFNPKTDKPQIPSSREIKTILENQKMEGLSKKLLQDLRQKAVIEIRS